MQKNKTRLSVNINKIALLRNARGSNLPNLIQFAKDCERFGAEGITVHPRPDERHIRYQDVYDLKPIVTTEYNIEGYPNKRFLQLIADIRPEQCTLVPDSPDVLTSNAGWDTVGREGFLTDIVAELHELGCRVCLFAEPKAAIMEGAVRTKADRIEFYTGPYAHDFSPKSKQKAVQDYVEAAKVATELGLGINAGHDLNLDNLAFLKQSIPNMLEVSIGHALVSDALYLGLENTIQLYLRQLNHNP